MAEIETQADRTRRFDLRALYESSQLLSSSLDLDFILNNLLLTLMSKLFVTRGCVLLRRETSSQHLIAASKGFATLKTNDEVELGDFAPDDLVLADAIPQVLADHKVALVAPIRFGGTEIGIAAMGAKATRDDFNKHELEFVKSLVNMSSSAINNSMVVDELRTTNRNLDNKIQQLNTLFDISKEFNATVDRDRLVKLLSFALMGQMMVRKHLFVLRRKVEDESEDGDGFEIQVVSRKGAGDEITPDFLHDLCGIDSNVLADNGQADDHWLKAHGYVLALPIKHQGETCGMLCLGPKMAGTYQPGEIEFLTALANLAFVSIQNSYLVEEQIEKERLEEEMRLARVIQEGLQPSQLPAVEGTEIAMLALPSRHVAGDYTDVIQLDDKRVLLAIGDVTGKGMPASLLMSNLQASLRTLVPLEIALSESTGHINRVICDNTGFDKFITYFHGIFDSSDRSFHYVNAGHNPPMLVHSDGSMEELEVGGLLLGVMKGMPYERGDVSLQPGDVLAMFTDGVTEAMSPDEEEFEEHRLEAVLRENRQLSAQGILDAVREAIISWTGSATALSDDLTMLVLKVSE
ncbi:MAG: SpoIIE family protein phosphatase [Rhodothermales bacterium]|nr:SpoIIE family protein phosphatase [Rhodothermales bacterium]